MTLLEIMIVLAILAIVMGLLVGPAVIERWNEARIGTTRMKVNKYAVEAFTAWSVAHPEQRCPDQLAALSPYTNGGDMNDAWGQPLVMLCGGSLPAGARGIAVMSVGRDGRPGTADDLKSWE